MRFMHNSLIYVSHYLALWTTCIVQTPPPKLHMSVEMYVLYQCKWTGALGKYPGLLMSVLVIVDWDWTLFPSRGHYFLQLIKESSCTEELSPRTADQAGDIKFKHYLGSFILHAYASCIHFKCLHAYTSASTEWLPLFLVSLYAKLSVCSSACVMNMLQPYNPLLLF